MRYPSLIQLFVFALSLISIALTTHVSESRALRSAYWVPAAAGANSIPCCHAREGGHPVP